MEDDPWGEGITKVTQSVGPVWVHIADVNVKFGGVLVVVADDIDSLYGEIIVVPLVKESVVFNVNYTNRYTEMVWLPRNVFVKKYLLDKMFQRVHLDLSQNTAILFSCHSHVHALQSIVRTDIFRFHSLSCQNNVDFLLLMLRKWNDDAWALACLLQLHHKICRLSGFCVDDVFVLVEDSFS